jgi:hypothetical protein
MNQDENYVSVTDVHGEEYYCPVGKAKNQEDVTDDLLDECVDSATAKRYSGNIKVLKGS